MPAICTDCPAEKLCAADVVIVTMPDDQLAEVIDFGVGVMSEIVFPEFVGIPEPTAFQPILLPDAELVYSWPPAILNPRVFATVVLTSVDPEVVPATTYRTPPPVPAPLVQKAVPSSETAERILLPEYPSALGIRVVVSIFPSQSMRPTTRSIPEALAKLVGARSAS